MDFESLAKVISKVPLKWAIDDVAKWLAFIGLDNLQGAFREAGIDGSILEDLEPLDLQHELNIKSNIVRKKLMNWIRSGLKDYTNFLQTVNKENVSMQRSDKMDIELDKPTIQVDNTEKVEKVRQLIIVPEEGTQSSMFCVNEDGGKIGRHSSNSILVIEESVSRYHAEIGYDRKKELFKLVDLKSSTGTYLKIDTKLMLRKGLVVELGSYQFLVEDVKVGLDEHELVLTIIQGIAANKEIRLSAKSTSSTTFKIGRKDTNEVFFQDTHLSSIHAVITFASAKFSIEDMNSTNGTWLRLGQDPVVLDNNSVFKVGAVSIYKVQYSDLRKNVQQIRSDNCVVCYENDRDALYLPCKHNLVCLRCSKMMRECPVCREKIVDTIKIYK